MIEVVRVLNTKDTDLESTLSVGQTIDTSSGLVLIDPKRGLPFLRMLSTSLDSARYFEAKGISRLWKQCNLACYREFFHQSNSLEDAVLMTSGYFDEDMRSVLNSGRVHPYFQSWLKSKHPLSDTAKTSVIDSQNWLIEDRGHTYKINNPGKGSAVYEMNTGWVHCAIEPEYLERLSRRADFTYDKKVDYKEWQARMYISKAALLRLQVAKAQLSERTDANVWQYLKPEITGGGDVFTQEIVDRNFLDAKYFDLFIYPHANYQYKQVLFTKEKDPLQIIRNGLENIDSFFQQGVNPVFTEALPPGAEWSATQILDNYLKREIITPEEYEQERKSLVASLFRSYVEDAYSIKEPVPEGSQLVVFVDMERLVEKMGSEEKVQLQDLFNGLLVKYSPRLQFFVSANDPTLLGMNGAKRLVM